MLKFNAVNVVHPSLLRQDGRWSKISSTQITSQPSTKLLEVESTPHTEINGKDVESTSLPKWIDCGDYWLNTSPQGSAEWLKARKNRLTGSNFGTAIGYGLSYKPPKTPAKLARYISGIEEEKFSNYSKEIMQEGNDMEPIAREWYEKANKVTVLERGLIVPKWNPYIGASVDGDILDTDGGLEIKCPRKMYRPLAEHTRKLKFGWTPPSEYYHDHIWETHYCQMIGGMAILGKKWFDYEVFCYREDTVFTDRVKFNEEYWKDTLYKGMIEFLDKELFPIMTGEPEMPE